MTPDSRYIKPLFYSAAIFNGLACVIVAPWSGIAKAMGFMPLMTNSPFDQVALLAFGLFGIGYWMVACNPAAHRGIILLGIIGKSGVAAILWGHHFLLGDVNLAWVALSLGDVLYGILFIQVLRALPATAPSESIHQRPPR